MKRARPPRAFLRDYDRERRHPDNRRLHAIALPMLYLAVIMLLWTLPLPAEGFVQRQPMVNWAMLFFLATTLYAVLLAALPGLLTAAFALGCVLLTQWLAAAGVQLWVTGAALVIAAWLLIAAGHRAEGNQRTWLGRSQYLPVGLVWLMGRLLDRLGVPW